jgi:hypothetical protein
MCLPRGTANSPGVRGTVWGRCAPTTPLSLARTAPPSRAAVASVRLLGLVVDIAVTELLEVCFGHLPSSVVLGLEPPSPHRGVDGVHRIPAQFPREDLRAARGAAQGDGQHRHTCLVIKISWRVCMHGDDKWLEGDRGLHLLGPSRRLRVQVGPRPLTSLGH